MTFTPRTRLGVVTSTGSRRLVDALFPPEEATQGLVHTAPFLGADDILINVIFISNDGTNLTGVEDLTDDFEIEEKGALRNNGTVDTSAGQLLVLYWRV